jgi:hypothetical protein
MASMLVDERRIVVGKLQALTLQLREGGQAVVIAVLWTTACAENAAGKAAPQVHPPGRMQKIGPIPPVTLLAAPLRSRRGAAATQTHPQLERANLRGVPPRGGVQLALHLVAC